MGARSAVVWAAAAVFASTAAPAWALDEPQFPTSLLTVADPRILEASGLALSSDGKRYYTMGDARGAAEVYIVNERGATDLTLTVPSGLNEDWEDISTFRGTDGKGYIYIADMGDAYFVRRQSGQQARVSFAVLRMDEPAPTDKGTNAAAQVITYPMQYSDKAARNSESLLVQPGTGRIFVLDKTEKPEQRASLWVAPATLEARVTNVLRRVVPNVGILKASAAAFSPTGDRLVVRNHEKAYVWRVKNGDVAAAFKRQPVEIALPTQRQGEGIAFTADGHALLTNSEGPKQPIWRVPLPPEADTEAPVAAAQPGAGMVARERSRDTVMIAVAAVSGLVSIALIVVNLGRIRRNRRPSTAR